MPTRDTLHQLVDALPDSELARAEEVLKALAETPDPVLRALEQAPYDDEGEDSEEERRAVEEARTEADRDEGIPHQEVKRGWGLE